MWADANRGYIWARNSWWSLWNEGISVSFLMNLIFYVPLLVMSSISYINDDVIGFTFLFWAEVCTWFSFTAFWIGPLLMMIAETMSLSTD
jgi:hypothetical protein